MTIRIYANRHGYKLEHVSVAVAHDRVRAEDGRGMRDRFSRFITLTGALDDVTRERLLQIAGRCPVSPSDRRYDINGCFTCLGHSGAVAGHEIMPCITHPDRLTPMVTVFRAHGLHVVIFTDDHLPAHVQVFGDGHAKIDLPGSDGLAELIWADGMTRTEARRAMRTVTEQRTTLLVRWESIHGRPD